MKTEDTNPEATNDRLVHSSLALLSSNVMGALLGVAFWTVAAHRYSPSNVGSGAAEISSMTLIASISQFSPSVIFTRFLYASGKRSGRILAVGYALGTSLAMVLSTLFVLLTRKHAFVPRGWLPSVIFVVATMLWVVFTIEDSALTGLRATTIVPIENTFFSLAKLALLPLFATSLASEGVFSSWIIPVVGCVAPVNYYLFRKVIPRHSLRLAGSSMFPPRKVLTRIVAGEYFSSLATMALLSLPALLIYKELGSAQEAYFQTPWLIGTSFDFLMGTIAFAVLSEVGARPSQVATTIRKAVKLAALLLMPAMVILTIGAPFYLRLLGIGYGESGTHLLQLLLLTMPFGATNFMYVTFARLARRVRRVVVLEVSYSAITLILMALLMRHFGLTGVGVAFMLGQAIPALAVLPSVIRQYRRPDMTPNFIRRASI
jgi:O-antigen/teichoic acid export membrane protein